MTNISRIGQQAALLPNTPASSTASTTRSEGPLANRTLQDASARPSLLSRLSATIERNMPGHSLLDRALTSDGKPNQSSRFSFSMIMDRLLHLAVRMSLGTVRDSVPQYGGTVSFKFAQTKGTFLGEIMKHKETAGGVCESVSAHWISSHAKGGNLFDKLYTGGQKGQFQIDTLVSIKQLQMDGVQDNVDQARVTSSWLKDNGVEPRMGKYGYPAPVASGETGSQGVARLLDAILDTNGEASEYKKISFSGKMAGHTVAACVDEQKGVTFFDPNFGEFHFPDKQSFGNWFSDAFWSGSKYNLEIGLGQEYEVHSFKGDAA